MQVSVRKREKESLDQAIREVLGKAPQIKGFTIKEISEKLNRPWPTTRWHLELMEARGEVLYQEIGRAKLYFLKNDVSGQKER